MRVKVHTHKFGQCRCPVAARSFRFAELRHGKTPGCGPVSERKQRHRRVHCRRLTWACMHSQPFSGVTVQLDPLACDGVDPARHRVSLIRWQRWQWCRPGRYGAHRRLCLPRSRCPSRKRSGRVRSDKWLAHHQWRSWWVLPQRLARRTCHGTTVVISRALGARGMPLG